MKADLSFQEPIVSAMDDSPKGRLLSAAAHLFKQKGFERTTVRDLAKEVGIQSGSIFHHFKSKEEILKSVMVEAILYTTARMKQALQRAQTPEERVLALITCELQSINGETGEAMNVLVYEWRSLSPDNQTEILALRDIYEGLWLSALQEAQDKGLLKADLTVLRRFLNGALSWTSVWFDPKGTMDVDELAKEAMMLVFK